MGDAPPPKTACSFSAAFAGHPRIQDYPITYKGRVGIFVSSGTVVATGVFV